MLDLDEAIRLGKDDLPSAIAAIQRLHTKARRRKDVQKAHACLTALRLFTRVIGDIDAEERVARRLVRERALAFDVYWLGGILERRGDIAKAVFLYKRALEACVANGSKDDEAQVRYALAKHGLTS